jgi:hypothetical protein
MPRQGASLIAAASALAIRHPQGNHGTIAIFNGIKSELEYPKMRDPERIVGYRLDPELTAALLFNNSRQFPCHQRCGYSGRIIFRLVSHSHPLGADFQIHNQAVSQILRRGVFASSFIR